MNESRSDKGTACTEECGIEMDYGTMLAAVKALESDQKTGTIVLSAAGEWFSPKGTNIIGVLISIVLGGIMAWSIAWSEETVCMTQEICGGILEIQLAIFGCILAVYSILLAFQSDVFIKHMVQAQYNDKGMCYLAAYCNCFEKQLVMYFFAIMISFICKLTVQCMPQYWTLLPSNSANEILAFLLLAAYFIYSIRVIYELKSIVKNTLFLFKTSLRLRIVDFMNEPKK